MQGMLTNDELIAVAAAAREAIRVELVEMWDMPDVHLPDALTPGMVRAVVDVLGRDYGVVRVNGMGDIVKVYREHSAAKAQKPAEGKPAPEDLADHWPALEEAIPDEPDEPEPEPVPAGPRVSLPLAPKPPSEEVKTAIHVSTSLPKTIIPNGNGHAPAKRPANLDVPPVPLPAAPPKRPASAWAKKLDITGDLAGVVGRLETGEISWRTLDNEQRRPIVVAVLNWMRARGWRLTQADADTHRPPWMPTSQAWVVALGDSWSDLVAAASKEAGL